MEESEIKKPPRGFYLLPNMLTTMSMFLGFLAIVWAGQEKFATAGMAILVSALMDSLDGKVARLTNTASEFGVQFDSLADLIAFGLAPALLLWYWQLENLGRIGIGAAFIYAACGALRLARFNITTASLGKRFFIGLPIPAGGCAIVTFLFMAGTLPKSLAPLLPWAALTLAVLVGLLMVSSVRYFSFKEFDFFRAHPVRVMVSFLFLLALLISFPRGIGFLYALIYLASGPAYTWILLPRHNRRLARAVSTPQD